MSNFPELPQSVTALEDEVLERWRTEGTFRQSLEKTADGQPFVFYEGPPTANGRPGIHHVLSRTIKDTVARFRTMKGLWVPRMAGWVSPGTTPDQGAGCAQKPTPSASIRCRTRVFGTLP